jgi:hypothetical protein
VSDYKRDNQDLEVLLELDGEVFPMDNGCWTKFEAKKVESSKHIPHGVKYSLTLHDRNNLRIVGYDNAHGIKPKRKKFGARLVRWDHKHERQLVEPYEFESPAKLLEDFWISVNKIIGSS